MERLLTPEDLDRLLTLPRGQSMKLVKGGLMPHIVLPTGEIRFDRDTVTEWLRSRTAAERQGARHE